MFVDLTPDQHQLRRKIRDYFTELMTPELKASLRGKEGGDEYRNVIRQMGKDGWLAVGWPKEHGGQGYKATEQLIFFEEANIAGAPLPFVTISTVGPALMELEEYQQIMADGALHPSHRNLIMLSVYTGMRTGEVRALAWEDIDLEAGTIKVQRNIAKDEKGEFFKLPKTDVVRTLYLLPPALEALKAQREYTELFPATTIEIHLDKKTRELQQVRPVFRPTTALPHDNHHAMNSVWYSESSLSSQWRNILKRCKVPYRRIYQTRHTFACWQLTAHGNIAFIADQMGHTDYSMLVKTYGRWMNAESQNEVARIWSALENKGHSTNNKCPISAPRFQQNDATN